MVSVNVSECPVNAGEYLRALGDIGEFWRALGDIGEFWRALGNIGELPTDLLNDSLQ